MAEPAAKPSNWNAPNAITVVRIFFAPAFLWLMLADAGQGGSERWWAGGLFIVGIATDGVDGYLARRNNQVTELGKLLDPIADKVLTLGALIGLSVLGELLWWVTIVIAVREVGITVYRFAVLRDGVIPASRGGKAKTLLQAIAISAALLPFTQLLGSGVTFWPDFVLMGLALLLTVLSGLDYAWNAVRLARSHGSGPDA